MKLFMLLALLSSQAFALDICKFDMVYDLEEAISHGAGYKAKVSNAHGRFAPAENAMIFKAVKLQEWLNVRSVNEALDIFADYRQGSKTPGDLAGEIVYYSLKATGGNQKIALVHYFPGDNEYGAIFRVDSSGNHSMIAEVSDSEINCK